MAISKAELKKIATLKTKKGRSSENRFITEGIRVLEETLKFGFLPSRVFFSRADLSERGQALVKQFKSVRIEITDVSSKEMNAISDTESAQGLAAIFNVPEMELSKLYKPSYRRILLCDRISDPGNLGTLVRTALAFEFDMIFVTNKTVEIFSPKVVRASAGAIFGLPIAYVSHEELEQFKKSSNVKIIAAVAQRDSGKTVNDLPDWGLDDLSLQILAVGSEAEGLSNEVIAMSDNSITIKHSTKVESLNVAMAGAILMHDFYQRQRAKPVNE